MSPHVRRLTGIECSCRLIVHESTRLVTFNLHPTVRVKSLSLTIPSTGQVHDYDVPKSSEERVPTESTTETETTVVSTDDRPKTLAGQMSMDSSQERVSLGIPEAWSLKQGSEVKLKASWNAKLTDSMMGYYKSTWQNAGREEHYASTQFEPMSARRAYPSWDEPALKSTYTIAMVTRNNLTSLSNMPKAEERRWTGFIDLEGGRLGETFDTVNPKEWSVVRFQTTPLISSYLVAWANGAFAHVDSQYTSPLSRNIVPLRVYATQDLIHQAQFALEVKAKVLPALREIF